MEGTLATAFGRAMVVTIADIMDDGREQDRSENQPHKTITKKSQIKSIHRKSSSSYCSPSDTLYWLGGDCMRETAQTSLATITECATMKTDNTTDMAIVSPDKSCAGSVDSGNDTDKSKNTNDSISSTEMNTNANADIISQYHQKYQAEAAPNSLHPTGKSLFTGYEECTNYADYTDPLNSILVEDHTDDPKDLKETNSNKKEIENRSKYKRRINKSLRDAKTASEIEDSAWFAASWCGGYPSYLMYNNEDDTSKLKHPDYYAEFRPLRQYAFDEEDGDYSDSNLTPTRALLDGTSSADDGAATNDGNSVLTSVGSVQSFMMINHPHMHTVTPNTALTQKLQRKSRKSPYIVTPERGPRHLHKLIQGSGLDGSVRTMNDTDSENNPFDYALSQSMMRKLQKHLPPGKRGDSFWLQYSLIRDGASLDSLLEMVHRDAKNNSNNGCSVLAIETVEGEVFGAFLTQTWRRSVGQWYGGGQSFLWTTSTDNNAKKGEQSAEKHLRVFPYSFANSYVQLCDHDRLLIGGGDGGNNYERHCYGFGIALESDLMRGSSCPCTTFQSPSLSKYHADGATFEIRNLEIWTLTPCLSIFDNPSEGLVRVHKKDDRRKSKKDVPKPSVVITKNEQQCDSDTGDSLNDSGLECYTINADDIEDGRDLGSKSFPGAVSHNRNVRRLISQGRKNRNRYISQTATM